MGREGVPGAGERDGRLLRAGRARTSDGKEGVLSLEVGCLGNSAARAEG